MKRLVCVGGFASCLLASQAAFASPAISSVSPTAALFSRSAWADVNLGDINPKVFALALEAATSAVERGEAADPGTLTVIDYSRPSTEKRMWVYDLRTHALLFDELVSHGRGSGKTNATAFSNDLSSNMTSLGLFRTGETYVGHNGYSLRLDGLDPGVNDHARARAIVVHGAPYVNAATAKANGYLGRSLGCPAVRPEIARALIDTIKNGSLIFAYGADGPSGRGSAESGMPR
jgi:hypothetical protein